MLKSANRLVVREDPRHCLLCPDDNISMVSLIQYHAKSRKLLNNIIMPENFLNFNNNNNNNNNTPCPIQMP